MKHTIPVARWFSNLLSLVRKFNTSIRVGKLDKLQNLIGGFSLVEKTIFYIFVVMLFGSSITILGILNNSLLIEIPANGGSITEGVVGAPRFVNPLLVVSNTDRDLTALVYAGLLKATPDGTLIPELADSYSISEDGLTYTFTIRENATFHDGKQVTADDVIFTFELVQNPSLRSPIRATWEGVGVRKIDDLSVEFTLSQEYSPFLSNLTLGIVPKHIWELAQPESLSYSTFNVEPIGAGPYMVRQVTRNSIGIPESYELAPFDGYVLGKPHIEKIAFRFYANEEELLEALGRKEVNHISSVGPDKLSEVPKNSKIVTTSLPRVFSVFLNQNDAPLFANKEVRKALNLAVDRQRIIDEVLSGYGTPATQPLTTGITDPLPEHKDSGQVDYNHEGALEILVEDNWEFDEELSVLKKETKNEDFLMQFTLVTSNAPDLKQTAQILKENWESLGARVKLEFFETSDLTQRMIRPRDYEALLFGQIIGRDNDPFPFWHSSQRSDPGLNVALYANITADKALEKIRTETDKELIAEQYEIFQKEIRDDIPAVFIYTPDFIYLVDESIKGLKLGNVITPADRFLNIHEWHTETQRVWSLFAY